MITKKILIFALAFLLLAAGCGLKEGVIQKAPRSYLWFTGNTEGATVFIDDLNPIELSSERTGDENTSNDKANTNRQIHYEIDPGKHRVIVKKSGKEVLNRTLLLGNGITMEIKIP